MSGTIVNVILLIQTVNFTDVMLTPSSFHPDSFIAVHNIYIYITVITLFSLMRTSHCCILLFCVLLLFFNTYDNNFYHCCNGVEANRHRVTDRDWSGGVTGETLCPRIFRPRVSIYTQYIPGSNLRSRIVSASVITVTRGGSDFGGMDPLTHSGSIPPKSDPPRVNYASGYDPTPQIRSGYILCMLTLGLNILGHSDSPVTPPLQSRSVILRRLAYDTGLGSARTLAHGMAGVPAKYIVAEWMASADRNWSQVRPKARSAALFEGITLRLAMDVSHQ